MELKTEYAIQRWYVYPDKMLYPAGGFWVEWGEFDDESIALFDSSMEAENEIVKLKKRFPGTTYRTVKRQISEWEVV